MTNGSFTNDVRMMWIFVLVLIIQPGVMNGLMTNPNQGVKRSANNNVRNLSKVMKDMSKIGAMGLISASIFVNGPAFAEDELAAKYGKGFDSSLVDQTCLVNKCSLQSKACLADDPSCRKGLTCTAKCLGDNACITGCMARYGNKNLDNLLKCTIEDNECIKVAILDGGADNYGSEPLSPAPTVPNFNIKSMEGSWYKVVGYNPNYDCYACQKNTFTKPQNNNQLQVDVQFSMPRLLPDGSPPPPSNTREKISNVDNLMYGSLSVGLNEYSTHETMIFDSLNTNFLHKNQKSYARTAHSQGEMFGLKFWENWYVIGENDPNQPEFKFIYYNGKTRQNTYEGAFVYSRQRELDPISMKKVYKIASQAGMNPNQFCKIRNGCFDTNTLDKGAPANPLFRKIMASTRISELLGVEPVSAEPSSLLQRFATDYDSYLNKNEEKQRSWWYEIGDYLEDPHRHFKAMDSLRLSVDWPN